MTVDIMPWLVSMRKLDRYNIMNTYDRWAEEVQALLAISGVSKAINEKGGEGDETAKAIIMLSLERDLRDMMAGKVSASTAADLWSGVKKAKKVLVSVNVFLVFPPPPSHCLSDARLSSSSALSSERGEGVDELRTC